MSKTATRELIKDSEPLFEGTHKGASGSTTLVDRGACFRSLGVDPELTQYIENVTQSTASRVSSVTEDQVISGADAFPVTFPFTFIDQISWDNGDTYRIYATSEKNSVISSTWCDVSRGQAITDKDDITNEGWFREDVDVDDKGRAQVFGPLQPEV